LFQHIRASAPPPPQFDVETAITVCRQAAYHQHALYLAHRHKQHHHYLKILLDDLHAYSDGLEYIASLDFYDAERYVRDYGLRLMNASGARARIHTHAHQCGLSVREANASRVQLESIMWVCTAHTHNRVV
jgi:hypothetical protein